MRIRALTLASHELRLRGMASLRRLALTGASGIMLAACARKSGAPVDELTALPSPAASRSGESNLAVGPDGDVHMSWLERLPDSSVALRYARLAGSEWSTPQTIRAGSDFFVNWADFPSLAVTERGRLIVHWLQRSSAGKYSYDTWFAQSADAGKTWSAPAILNRDATPSEHGFVSLVAAPGDSVLAFWLDGRTTKPSNSDDHGAMQLRAASIAATGALGADEVVDDRTCDCCQTAGALTARGPVVVYRDRSAGEIRDITISRRTSGGWSAAAPVHSDNWQIDACPVNGPAIIAASDTVVVAWFTGARDTAKVQLAFSSDAGATFGPPVRVDDGNPVGRVALVFDAEGNALVAWVERSGGESAEVRLRRVTRSGAKSAATVVTRSSAARTSGFPRMVRRGNDLIVSWTEPGDTTRVRVATARLRGE